MVVSFVKEEEEQSWSKGKEISVFLRSRGRKYSMMLLQSNPNE